MPLSLPRPADLFDLPRSVVDSLRSAAAALPRAEALLPRLDDVLTKAAALLDRVPSVTRGVPPLVDTASELLERLSAVVTPERTAAVGDLVDRLDGALSPARVEATAQALDGLASRPELLPRALEVIDRLAASRRVDLLADALERVLSDPGLDRLLQIAADERIERLLDLAADERIERLLHRADEVLHDERLSRVGGRLDRLVAEDHLSVLQRLGSLFTEERTAHLASLADRVPRMVAALDDDLPTGPELRRMPADLHAMLEVLDDLHQVLSGMPGAARARARGEDPHPQV